MRTRLTVVFFLIACCILPALHAQSALLGEDVDSEEALEASILSNRQWPSYRGYFASGFIDGANLPDSFNIQTSHHVKWTLPIPGLGLSCPAIWGERIYVTTAVSEQDQEGYKTGLYGDIAPVQDSSEHRWLVYSIDKETGKVLWEREAHRGIPQVKRHPKSSHANTTIATDGYHVVAFFGSEGLYCYNNEGDLLWTRDFGLINSAWNVVESAEWEFSSSPVIFQDKVVLQADALNTAFVAVLNLETGETLWRKERDEIPGWCTPNIYFDGNKSRVAVNGYQHRGGYDLETGTEVWKMAGGGDIPIPTPIVWKDLIFFNSAHGRHAPLMAIRNSAAGTIEYPGDDNVTGEDIAWFKDRGGAYMSSVLVYQDLLYQMRWNGNLSCLDAATGSLIYEQTVHPSSFVASPVAADGKIYLVSETGDVYIIGAGKTYQPLIMIPLGEPSLVTPGIAPGIIIFRTASRLIAIAKN